MPPQPPLDVEMLLRGHGMQVTAQRLAVMRAVTDHPHSTVDDIDKVVRADIGIVAVKELSNGLQIVEVNKGGPAESAGLQGWKAVRKRVSRGPLTYDVERQDPSTADIIVAVDGQPVDTASAFVDKIEEHQPGERLNLTILRQGHQMEVPVTLGSN